MNTITSVTFEGSLLVESSLPLVFLPQTTQLWPLSFPGPGTNATHRCSPQQVSPGHSSLWVPRAAPPARSAHRGGCGLGWSLRGHVTAAIRAAGCGLPPSLLAAVTYRRPAPPTHPTQPHHDRYAHVTGPRGAAAPTPGKLQEARELPWSPAADRAGLQSGGFRLRHPGKGRRGGAGAGRTGIAHSPEGLLPRGTASALRKHWVAALLWPLH